MVNSTGWLVGVFGASAAAVSVSVARPDGVTVGGANVPVTPDGRPLTARLTGRWKPSTDATLIVKDALPPGGTPCTDGDTTSEKSPEAGSTTIGRVTARNRLLTSNAFSRGPNVPLAV